MSTKITFNGTEYERPEDMPPAIRAAYENATSSKRITGKLIERMQTGGSLLPKVNVKVSTKLRLVYDGKVYDNIDQMPADVRAKYQNAIDQVDKDHNGVPDFLEGGSTGSSAPQAALGDSFTPSAPLMSQPPVIVPERSTNGLLVVAALTILLLLIVIVALALYILVFAH